MSEPIQYYSLFKPSYSSWTGGYRRVNGKAIHQDPQWPWLLTYQEVVQWIKNDWLTDWDGVDMKRLAISDLQIKEHSPEYIIIGLKYHADEMDRQKRIAYAEKYL